MNRPLHTLLLTTALLANLAIPEHYVVLPACCQGSGACAIQAPCCDPVEVNLRPSETVASTAAQAPLPLVAQDELLASAPPVVALAEFSAARALTAVATAPPALAGRDLLARHARLNL